jgi:hypothetical protein
MVVDRGSRRHYVTLEPALKTLFDFCESDVVIEKAWLPERRSLAARVICMLVHRDPVVRSGLIQVPGVLETILRLVEMDNREPGATHVKLCIITALAILIMDDAVMEYIREKGMARRLLEACLTALENTVEILIPGHPLHPRTDVERKCYLSITEGVAMSTWGAAYEACLPGGGGMSDADCMKFAKIGNQLLNLCRDSEMPLEQALRCVANSLCNTAANEQLAEVMMRPLSVEFEPIPDDISESDDDTYFDTPWQRAERENKIAEKRAALEARK